MSTILERIVASKRSEIAVAMASEPETFLERKLSSAPPPAIS